MSEVPTLARSAGAGAAAALAWAAFDPVGRRIFGTEFSDVRLVGLPLHLANGALFGVAYRELARRRAVPALAAALVEHVALWPFLGVFDRRAVRDPRAFASSSAGHAVFGLVLGALV
jgi:hypothetical protein